jgi:hypothetical protein
MDLTALLASPIVMGILITLGTLLSVGLIFALVFGWLARLSAQRGEEAQQKYPGAKTIIRGVSFFGQESHGVTQGRGNGTLILTEDKLVFERWLPRRTYEIPLASIRGFETPKSFLGKSRFTPLLKVVFQNESGQTDSMAWQVPDLEGLKRTIEELRG